MTHWIAGRQKDRMLDAPVYWNGKMWGGDKRYAKKFKSGEALLIAMQGYVPEIIKQVGLPVSNTPDGEKG